MQNVTNEDLVKISEFVNSVDGLINGKFILADIKITNILKMIAANQTLYSFIKNTLIDFSFDKELMKAEVKNRLNNGVFTMPNEKSKIIAFVFCFLVECDAKRIDFYSFIHENFQRTANFSDYANFANTMLVPFKEIIVEEFYREPGKEDENVVEESEEKSEQEDIFASISKHLNQMMDNIVIDRRIKSAEKENLNYIIKNIIYSMKYKDLKIVNAFISVLDILADRYACLRLPLKDIKSDLLNYYNKLSQ